MDLQGKSRQELADLLIKLSASLNEKDLENPENFALASQLVQILDDKAEPLPQDLVDQLGQIKDKADRFRQAAMYIGAMNPDKMKRLAEAMKAAGLMKSEDVYTHEGYKFKEAKHEKTPEGHKAYEITSPEGKTDTLFARDHKEVAQHIANELHYKKKVLNKAEPKVMGGGFGTATPGPKITNRDQIKIGDVHAVTQYHPEKDNMPAHKSQNLFRVTGHETSKSGNQDVIGHFVAHDDRTTRQSAGKDFPLRFGSKTEVNPHVDFHHVEQAPANAVTAQAAPTAGPVEENTPKAALPKIGIKKEKKSDIKAHAQHKANVNYTKEALDLASKNKKSAEAAMNRAINSADEFPEHKGREQKMIQKKQAYAVASEHHLKAHADHLEAVKGHLAFLNEKLGKSDNEGKAAASLNGDSSSHSGGTHSDNHTHQGSDHRHEALSKSLNESLEKAAPLNFDNSHIVMHPVSIRGSTSDAHNPSLPQYHVTVKVLGEKGPKPDGTEHHVAEVAERHDLTPPKAEDIRLKPHKFTTKTGDVHHVLLLDGAHVGMAGANKELQHISPDHYPFLPHITVSKELHDEVKEKGLTAKDLDLKVHPLEYRIGNRAIKRYEPKPKANEQFPPMKVAKAETMKDPKDLKKAVQEVLEKRSKNVRRELARLNSGKSGEAKTVARETNYMKQKLAVDETHSLPSEGDLAEKHFGDRKATDKLTNEHKKAAGWKANANGDYIRKPEISHEEGNLKVTHMPTPKSVRHETAHAVRATGSLPDLNQKMQGGYGKIKSAGAKSEKEAGLKAKAAGASESEVKAAKTKGAMKGNPHAWQGEYETNGIENSIARRTGSLPPRNIAQRTIAADVEKYGKGPKDHRDAPQVGMNGAKEGKPIHAVVPEHTAMESSVVRRDREAKQRKSATPAHAKAVKEARAAGKPDPAKMPAKEAPKMVHLASLSSNVRPEIKEKVKQKLDTGEIKYNKQTKQPEQARNIDAKINGRAEGRVAKPSQMTGAAKPAKKEPEQLSLFPQKLAASEAALKPGMSYNKLKKSEKK